MESRSKFTICRLCLYKSECLIDIFEVNVRYGYVAAEVIADLLQFQVQSMDIYPRVVCSRCLDKLTEFKVFKEQCKASRATYDNLFVPSESYPDVQYIPNPMGLRTVKMEPIEITDDDMSSQMSCRSENMDPDEIITDQVTTTQTCIKAESSGREDMVAMDNASTQEDLVHVPLKSVEVSSVKEISCQANYSSSISDQKYAMKEVSTQVSFSPMNTDHKFSLNEVPNQSSKKKRDETPEQRLKRLERQRNYYNQRKQTESPDKREARLSKMRELATRRRENESQLQREERLSQLRMYAVKRIANESTDQREQRLRNMRIYAENRLANETLEQRQRRLGHAPFNAQEKKVGERRERKGHAEGGSCEERSTDSVPGEAFGGHDRLYEPQGQFQEYLSQLGLGIVEQRVSQMQEQYHYGHPRNLVPDQEKYIGHFNQLASNLTHGQFGHQRHLVPEHAQFGQMSQEKFAGLATHGQPCTSERRPHESQEQYLQRTRQVNLYVPERANSQQGQQVAQQGHHQVQKKVTEVKMYEVL